MDPGARQEEKNRQRELVAACRAAMPDPLDLLWDTIVHAPNVALPDVATALVEAFPRADQRMTTLLGWYGHSDGSCPVCWMLVGKLVFTIPEPIECLRRALSDAPTPRLLSGAGLFLSSHLELRHAKPVGVSREGLELFQAEARALPAAIKSALRAHWEGLGRDLPPLERRF